MLNPEKPIIQHELVKRLKRLCMNKAKYMIDYRSRTPLKDTTDGMDRIPESTNKFKSSALLGKRTREYNRPKKLKTDLN